MARIGVDVGGTNTDLILETTERDSIGRRIFSHKVPTTLEDQSIAVMRGILELCAKAGIGAEEVDLIVHGTTVATNISIEHNGAEVGMLTTRGFRDILHIGRHKRPYNSRCSSMCHGRAHRWCVGVTASPSTSASYRPMARSRRRWTSRKSARPRSCSRPVACRP